jgi:sarcosine oxidase, subunit gamma
MTKKEAASMDDVQFQSPLAHRAAPNQLSISMREISERGMIDLRGMASDKKFVSAAKSVLGFDLPKAPRTSASWGDLKALWLSPDQWLILCPRSKTTTLLAELNSALSKIHSLAVDVSDMRAIIRLEGEGVRETLMKGSSLDLISDDYKAGTVRRMRFAEIAALLHVVEDQVIDIYMFRSYAEYTWAFLTKAARKGTEVKLFGARI